MTRYKIRWHDSETGDGGIVPLESTTKAEAQATFDGCSRWFDPARFELELIEVQAITWLGELAHLRMIYGQLETAGAAFSRN